MKYRMGVFLFLAIIAGSAAFMIGANLAESDQETRASRVIEHAEAALGITPVPNGALCPAEPPYSAVSWEQFKTQPPMEEGLGYGFFDDDLGGAVRIGYETYRIAPETSYSMRIRAVYVAKPERVAASMRVVVLLDEIQIPAFSEAPYVYKDLVLKRGEEAILNWQLPPLEAGIHDLVVLFLPNGEVENESQVGIVPAPAARLTFVVGGAVGSERQEYLALTPTKLNYGNLMDYLTGRVFGDSLMNRVLNTPHAGLSMNVQTGAELSSYWALPDLYLEVEREIKFNVAAGYDVVLGLSEHGITEQAQPMTLLFLLDGVQVPYSEEQRAFYGLASPENNYSLIPVTLDGGDRRGHSILNVIRINYPRFPVCWLFGSSDGAFFNVFVTTGRYGVEFK